MISQLTFERKILFKKEVVHEDRTYIDYVINGVSLFKLLGGISDDVGKFGWGISMQFELKEFERFKNIQKNEYTSLYVCQMCGDEYCGSVYCQIIQEGNCVKWENFHWGIPEQLSQHDDFSLSFSFDKTEYYQALNQLEKYITEVE